MQLIIRLPVIFGVLILIASPHTISAQLPIDKRSNVRSEKEKRELSDLVFRLLNSNNRNDFLGGLEKLARQSSQPDGTYSANLDLMVRRMGEIHFEDYDGLSFSLVLPLIKGMDDADFISLVRIAINQAQYPPSLGELPCGIISGVCEAVGPRSYDLLMNESKNNEILKAHFKRFPVMLLSYTFDPRVLGDTLEVAGRNLSTETAGRLMEPGERTKLAKIMGRYSTIYANAMPVDDPKRMPKLQAAFDYLSETIKSTEMSSTDRAIILESLLKFADAEIKFADAAVNLAAKADALDPKFDKRILAAVAGIKEKVQAASAKSTENLK